MIIFKNKGELDLRAIRTFGISAKTNNDAIGFFGTGMKYAIAIFLREGFTVNLYTGGNCYEFRKKKISMREKDFEMITMNGEEMPFTTHLGVNWSSWQAFREFYCNALDESGDVEYASVFEKINDDETCFVVEGDDDFDLYEQRDSIVLKGDFDHTSAGVKIRFKETNWLYYRGIRVYKSDLPFMFTYNITEELILTEDRTVRDLSVARRMITDAIKNSNNESFIKRAICAKKDRVENGLYYFIEKTSEEFEQVASREFDKNNDDLHRTVRLWIQQKKERDTFKNIIGCTLSELESQMLIKAKRIVSKRFDLQKYEIIFSETLGQRTMAYVQSNQENKIYISKECFNHGFLYLTSTLLEEVVHHETGHQDETRELQTFLFDEMTKLLAQRAGEFV